MDTLEITKNPNRRHPDDEIDTFWCPSHGIVENVAVGMTGDWHRRCGELVLRIPHGAAEAIRQQAKREE
jgi:hypothetical protein